jgi:hypothetical protein
LKLINWIQKKCKDASFSQHPCFHYTKNPGAKLFLTKFFATDIVYLFVSYTNPAQLNKGVVKM